MANKKLKRSLKKYDKSKENKQILISGELGITLGGRRLVEVPGRKGFVYVRLKGNTSELIQAYNATVSPVYDLPVFVVRQTGIYKVVGRNIDRHQNQWGQAPFLPKHGGQHSFNHEIGAGGDVVWVYSQQFMPLLSYPSGTEGSMTLSIHPAFYEWEGSWRYAQNTGTPDYTPYLPTITGSARMVLSYIDPVDNSIKLVPGTPFSNSLTGSAQIAQYIPDIPRSVGVPLAAVRLVTGTTAINWNAIYDMRDFFTVGSSSGSAGGGGGGGLGFVGQDEGVYLATGTVLNVTGAGATLSVSGTVFNLDVPGGGGAVGSVGVMAWDEGQPLGTGTVFNFVGDGIQSSISGSVVRVSVSGSLSQEQVEDIVGAMFDGFGTGGIDTTYVDASGRVVVDGSSLNNRLASLETGWIPSTDTWTRTGDHTFTVGGDVTDIFRKGAKVQYNDGAVDYGVVGSSSHAAGTTTVNLIPNDDYAMAAATITDTYISYIENPAGWPDWFAYSPAYSASGSMTYTSVTTSIAKWRSMGANTIMVKVRGSGTTGGTASNAIKASLPIDAVDAASFPTAFGQINDGGPIAARCAIRGDTPNTVEVIRYDNANIGLGTGRVMNAGAIYEF